jgi:hypothetical protein
MHRLVLAWHLEGYIGVDLLYFFNETVELLICIWLPVEMGEQDVGVIEFMWDHFPIIYFVSDVSFKRRLGLPQYLP